MAYELPKQASKWTTSRMKQYQTQVIMKQHQAVERQRFSGRKGKEEKINKERNL